MIPALVLLLLGALAAVLALLHRKQALVWLPSAATHGLRNWCIRRPTPVHVLFCFVDHFEPSRGDATADVAAGRLQPWLDQFPELADAHCDSDGRPACHTFFYPWDEWRDGEVAALGQLCYDGYAEVELHLHHRRDTSAHFAATLAEAVAAFGQHGALLGCGAPTVPRFGFIHGNWCLDNSRPDGDWCGVNDELGLLSKAGCYADFTLPTPDGSQPRQANRIYRATDHPHHPKSHDRGPALRRGRHVPGDLLLIPGPLGINLRDWHHRWYPAIERGEIAASSPVSAARVDFWVRCGVGVRGRPDWVFVKVHAHGCVERDRDDVLGAARHRLHGLLESRYGTGRHALHYCTARELANLALAAEDGAGGEPGPYRDWRYPPPVNAWLRSVTPVCVSALSEREGSIQHRGEGPVDWQLKVGPVARVQGELAGLRWCDGALDLDRPGPRLRIEKRPEGVAGADPKPGS